MGIQVREREGYLRGQVLLLAEKGLAASATVGLLGFISPAAAFGRLISLRRRAPNPMKASFLLIAIFSLLVLCAPDVSGEASDPHSSLSGDAQHEYLRYLQDLRSKQHLEYLKQNNPYDSPVMYYRLYRKPEPFPWGSDLSPHWTGNGVLSRPEPPNRYSR